MKKYALLASLFLLAACERVKTPGGTIPQNYVAAAKALTGRYNGAQEKVGNQRLNGALVVGLAGNRPTLAYRDATGSDILDPRCHSRIGNLEWVFSYDGKKVRTASFTLDPGSCGNKVEGRSIELTFHYAGEKVSRIDASIVESSYQVFIPGSTHCYGGGPGNPPMCDTDPPTWETRYTYLSGTYAK